MPLCECSIWTVISQNYSSCFFQETNKVVTHACYVLSMHVSPPCLYLNYSSLYWSLLHSCLYVYTDSTPRKPTRGIQYLVMSDILEDDPRRVAEFLLSEYGLSKEKIGEFLGEINSDFNMAVLE